MEPGGKNVVLEEVEARGRGAMTNNWTLNHIMHSTKMIYFSINRFSNF